MEKSILEQILKVIETVYGTYTKGNWIPKPYADNKSRYLWTDAYGVCNFLTLYRETNDIKYLEQADALINNVHDTLGYERNVKKRLGNATDEYPTRGGLRIGKIEDEGSHDGDGQYFHYLTKWAFALSRMAKIKNDQRYIRWAIDLIKAIHPHFVYRDRNNQLHMYWKMSIDLTYPAVPSEGNLDPYDGYITYRLVDELAEERELEKEIADMKSMVDIKYARYRSSDPLDLGEALWITHWYPDEQWAKTITTKSLQALEELWQHGDFQESLNRRLAFREFGTTIGVQVNDKAGDIWKNRINDIHNLWLPHLYKRDKDISPVMFCTSLRPGVVSRQYLP
ncbi:unnamed protein product [Rotaria sordida]|uniref:Uncharacterized protein n=1 Tax=Rotaria sordida TaxID=392033 RepID=A0A818T439_9BILA|nr:unnamed protein product [Rotaria sordida]CAF3676552.1 unnamed protein product [Rotaria sordida]